MTTPSLNGSSATICGNDASAAGHVLWNVSNPSNPEGTELIDAFFGRETIPITPDDDGDDDDKNSNGAIQASPSPALAFFIAVIATIWLL